MRVFEAVSGQRMMTSYIRIGGVSLEPPIGLLDTIRAFLLDFPSRSTSTRGCCRTTPSGSDG